MITIAHLSDIHLAPLPPANPLELMNKRLTGYVNWRLRRRSSLTGLGLTALVAHLHAQDVDFAAVTGDLVNLGLPAEIDLALDWLRGIGPAEKVCVSPGNHDAYLPGVLTAVCTAWRDYVSGETLDDHMFPFARRIGEVAVVSCCSAIATPPFFSAGRFDQPQADRLARMLRLLGEGGYFRIVAIHHPPYPGAGTWRSGLWGAPLFREVIADAGAEIVLHGHTHRSTIHAITGPTRNDVPVIGVAAAGTAQHPRPGDDPARYNFFAIDRVDGSWTCTMTEFGFREPGTEVVPLLQVRIY